MRLPARLWFRRVHLILGLGLGVVLAAVAGSGAALVFRDEIRALDPAVRSANAVWDGVSDMEFPAARKLARELRPGQELQILWFPTKARPYYEAAFYYEGKKFSNYVRFHPATGETLAIPESPVLQWIEGFHVNLKLGAFGAFLVRWCTLLFSVLLLSGLYLWWPGWKPHLWFSMRGGRLRLWDAHRVLGFASTLPLLAMLVSGLVFAFPAAQAAVYYLTGEKPPASATQEIGQLKSTPPSTGHDHAEVTDETLLAAARRLSPPDAMVFYLTFPIAPDESRQVRLQRGYSPWPYGEVHRIYFDRYSGAVLGHLQPDSSIASRYLAQFNSELHYGTIGGLATQIVWLAACALVPFFAITGVLLWRRRGASRLRGQNASSEKKAATSAPHPPGVQPGTI